MYFFKCLSAYMMICKFNTTGGFCKDRLMHSSIDVFVIASSAFKKGLQAAVGPMR